MLARAALIAGFVASPAVASPTAARTQAAFDALQREQPGVRAVWRGGQPMLITGLRAVAPGASAAERAAAFIEARIDLVGRVNLQVEDVDVSGERSVVRFAQVHGDLRVADRSVVVTLDAGGRVTRVLNDAVPLVEVRPATIDAARARAIATEKVLGVALPGGVVSQPRKVVFAEGGYGVEGFLVLVARGPGQVVEVRVDGADGQVFGQRDTVLR
ncbi:MAG: hypothetical protein R3F60_06985 [bacterium]